MASVGPDLRIDWTDVCRNPDDFERLVKLLLQRLHPDGEVIDGRGGDGGREFQVRTPESLVLYEAKSFTGRVSERNPKRRAQVQRSLVSAARHQPNAWHLVVPIDHNPDELNWFDGLRNGDFPFIGHWRGQTWLEEQLAQHDDLVRYATADKLLEYVRLYKIETEALAGGVPDLLRRQRALAELGDTFSPHWRPVIGRLEDGTQVVALQAKHADAAKEAPIRFEFTAAMGNDPDSRSLRADLQDSLELGTRVVIPGSFVSRFATHGPPGLGLPGPDVVIERLVMGAQPETVDLPEQILAIYRPGAAFPVAQLNFIAKSRTSGIAGARLEAFDYAAVVQLVTVARNGDINIRLRIQEPGAAPPAAVLPALRLLRAMHHPNSLRLTVRQHGRLETHEIEIESSPNDDVSFPAFVDYLENLAVIQDVLAQPFPVPTEVTSHEEERASQLRRLLAGEVVPWVRGPVTITIDPSKLAEIKEDLGTDEAMLRISFDEYDESFGGHTVHVGPIFMTGAVEFDLDALPDESADGEYVPAVVGVIDDGWFHAQRGVPEDQSESPRDPPQPGQGRVAIAARPSP